MSSDVLERARTTGKITGLDVMSLGQVVARHVTARLFYNAAMDIGGSPIALQLNGHTLGAIQYADESGAKNLTVDLSPLLVPGHNDVRCVCVTFRLPTVNKKSFGRVQLMSETGIIADVPFNPCDELASLYDMHFPIGA